MASGEEFEHALGRYRASWLYLVLPSLAGACLVAAHVIRLLRDRGTTEDYVSLTVFPLLLTVLWMMPVTVVTTAGFRRAVGFRLTAWQDVALVFPSGPGDPDLLVGLRDGRKVSLVGVPQNRRAGVQALIAGSAGPGTYPAATR